VFFAESDRVNRPANKPCATQVHQKQRLRMANERQTRQPVRRHLRLGYTESRTAATNSGQSPHPPFRRQRASDPMILPHSPTAPPDGSWRADQDLSRLRRRPLQHNASSPRPASKFSLRWWWSDEVTWLRADVSSSARSCPSSRVGERSRPTNPRWGSVRRRPMIDAPAHSRRQ